MDFFYSLQVDKSYFRVIWWLIFDHPARLLTIEIIIRHQYEGLWSLKEHDLLHNNISGGLMKLYIHKMTKIETVSLQSDF